MNSFPSHDVSAMGRKLAGVVGSSAAELFPISLTTACFHCVGMLALDQLALKRSQRASTRMDTSRKSGR